MENITDQLQPKITELPGDITDYAENAAAVMFYWMENSEAYNDFYENHADKLGGFVGVQCLAARASIVFTNEACIYTPGEDYYWIEAIEDYAIRVFDCYLADNNPSLEDLHLYAAGSIEKCRL